MHSTSFQGLSERIVGMESLSFLESILKRICQVFEVGFSFPVTALLSIITNKPVHLQAQLPEGFKANINQFNNNTVEALDEIRQLTYKRFARKLFPVSIRISLQHAQVNTSKLTLLNA